MDFFRGIGNFFRGVFNRDDEEEKKRRRQQQLQQQQQPRPQPKPQVQTPRVPLFNQQPDKTLDPLGVTQPITKPKPVTKPAPQPRKRSVFEVLGDQFEANSPEDIAKRQAAGQPARYEDQLKDSFARRNLTPKGLALNAAHLAQESARVVPTVATSVRDAGQRHAETAQQQTLSELQQMKQEERRRIVASNRGLQIVLQRMGVDLNNLSDEDLAKASQVSRARVEGNTYTPGSRGEKFLFGNEKVESYQKRAEGTAKETGLNKNLIMAALLGLDLTPGGKAKKDVAEGVVKEAKNPLRRMFEALRKTDERPTIAETPAPNVPEDKTPSFMKDKYQRPDAKERFQAESRAQRGQNSPFYAMQERGLNPGDVEDIPAYQRLNGEQLIGDAEEQLATLNRQLEKTPEQTIQEYRFKQRQQLGEDIRRNPEKRNELIAAYQAKLERAGNLENLKLYRASLLDRKAALEAQIAETKAMQEKTAELVSKQADDLQAAQETRQAVNDEVKANQAAAGAPAKGDALPKSSGNPEVNANDAYQRFNEEAGLNSGSRDISYIDAQQELERMAGNRTMDELTGRQMFRVPTAINGRTQGAVADAVTNTAGKATGRMLTSQNPVMNLMGQLLYGLNKKSTLSNEQKALVEQARGRRGGIGNLRDQVVSKLEEPLANLPPEAQASVKEKVFQAFELYNNGQTDEALAIIKSFAPEERAYFDGVRNLNVLRNNLNRATMSREMIDQYDNGMHMPRIFDANAFAKEFTPDDIEAYAVSQNRTLDLNPNKRRKQLEDIAEEIRNQMLRDPAQASAIRTEIALHNKGVSDFAASVAHLPGAVSDNPLRGFLQVPEQAKYGELAGKYVRRDLAEPMLGGDLRFKSDAYRHVNALLDKYQSSVLGKVENGLRKLLTVYNPATRLGNRSANLSQGVMAGFNLPEMAVSQQHFVNVLRKGGDEWTRLARAFGAIDDNEALARFSGDITEPKNRFLRRASQSYSDIDTAAKVAMFKWQIQRGATPEQAARFVNRALPNIGNSGEIYSFFSKLPVLGIPFRAIQPEVIRSLGSSMGRNTAPFLVAMATYTTLQNMSWEGVPEEERQQIQERFGSGQTPFAGINKFFGEHGVNTGAVLPSSWSFNAGALFGKDPETGEQRVVDVDPRRLLGIYSINLGGDSAADGMIDQAMKASPVNIPASFNNGEWSFKPENIVGSRTFSPLFQALIDRDFRGKSVQDPEGKIYGENGVEMKYMNPETGRPESQSNAERLTEFLVRSYVPQTGDISNLQAAKGGKENFYGQEMNMPQAIARLFGLKGEEFNKDRLQKMRDTQEYFNEKAEIDKEVAGLSQADAEAYKRLTGYYKLRDQQVPNEFEPGSMRDKKAPQYEFSEDKWKEYAAHPKLYELMVEKKQREFARDGKPIPPEFDPRLSDSFRKQLIQNKMVAPGDDAELDQRMYSSSEWDYYQHLKDQYKDASKGYYPDSGNDEFVDELVKNQDAKFPTKPDILKKYSAAYALYADGKGAKPVFSDEMKKAKAEYNKQTFIWTNNARRARGLPAITWDVWNNPTFGFDESPSAASFGGRGGFGFGFGGSNYDPADHVNTLGHLTSFSNDISPPKEAEAQPMPAIAQLFAALRAGGGGGRGKPRLGASSSGR